MIFNGAYKEAVMDEEKVLKQKTKVEWLREGDHNSAYFHNLLKGRFSKSRILSIKDDLGNVFVVMMLQINFLIIFMVSLVLVMMYSPLKTLMAYLLRS